MKTLLTLILCTMMTGCWYQSTSNIDIKKAIYFCEGVENIVSVEVQWDGMERIYCVDGSKGLGHEIKLPRNTK